MKKFFYVQWLVLIALTFVCLSRTSGDDSVSSDWRSGPLRDLNGYFPFKQVENRQQWQHRQSQIRRRISVSQGLWPLPTKAPLNAVIHGRVERDDYVVDRVYFESVPDHYVTGSLYRPKNFSGRIPAILSPHGHWNQGRFYDAGQAAIVKEIETGAEQFPISGRYPIQARAVQLARMGCMVFVYDMTGYADSVQLSHRPKDWKHLNRPSEWGFMSVQADLRLQNMMGLQTWNSIRAIDFLLQLDETDPSRIGVTGASGGGTQSMIVGAIDDRIAAAMPCVMVSTAMQGGCTCENAPLLRIDQGNVDIAAAIAPRPLGLTAADDWTVELETKGFPDLAGLYQMLGHPDRLTAAFHVQFPHNYNQLNRLEMYAFFNRHFKLGFAEPITERDFDPLSIEEASVWTVSHPKPTGDQVGDVHEVNLLKQATADTNRQLEGLIPTSREQLTKFREVVGGGWQTILGRTFDELGDVQFTETSMETLASMTIRVGRINHRGAGEQVSVVIYEPAGESTGIVIQVTDEGKQSFNQQTESVLAMIKQGYTVVTADLYGQGDSLSDGQSQDSQRTKSHQSGEAWQNFSGYTYGYNHSLFALRVHDVLTLVKYARSKTNDLRIHGSGAMAGPIAAAACGLAADQVAAAVIDPSGFTFQSVSRHDHPMFVPGAVKYFDIDGLLSLIAPTKLTVLGKADLKVTRSVYQASGRSQELTLVPTAGIR